MDRRGWARGLHLQPARVEDLEAIAVTAVLPAEARRRVAAASLLCRHPRHEVIEWSEHGAVALGVAAGAVEITLGSRDGDEVPVLRRGAGQVAELPEGGWSPPNTTTATVISAGAIAVLIPAEPLWAEVRLCPPAADLLRAAEWERTVALGALAGNGLFHNPDARIDHEILRATDCAPDGSAVFLQSYLARRARTDDARVSRRLKALRSAGIIRTERAEHRIITLDRSALEDGTP